MLVYFQPLFEQNHLGKAGINLSTNTLQVGLSIYSGELNVQWHFILAMTVVTMIPVVLVFVFLQRFITTGIAGTGLK